MVETAAESVYMVDSDQYGQLNAMGQLENTRILTPALCRAARGFLDWTQAELADRSGVSRSTVRDYEGSRHDVHRATEAQLRLAFEGGGIIFFEVEKDNIGICCANDPDTI